MIYGKTKSICLFTKDKPWFYLVRILNISNWCLFLSFTYMDQSKALKCHWHHGHSNLEANGIATVLIIASICFSKKSFPEFYTDNLM